MHALTLLNCAAPISICPLQEAEEERLRNEFAKQGILIPKKERTEIFDSNTITPGTPFMHRLSIALQYYVHLRLNSDPGWKDIEVRDCCGSLNGPGSIHM
jgi:5'-3' exoribonuclease 2